MTKRSRAASPGSSRSDLSRELDAAFAAVQAAIGQQAFGAASVRASARERVSKIAVTVKLALREENRTETEKRDLEAKLGALIAAAERIPEA